MGSRGNSSSKRGFRRRGGPTLPGKLLEELGEGGVRRGSSFRGRGGAGGKARRNDPRKVVSGKKRGFAAGAEGRDAPEGTGNVKREKKVKQEERVLTEREDDPELAIQKRLAKKLGMKSTALNKNEDGLDDLLNELDDIMMGNDDDEDSSSGTSEDELNAFESDEESLSPTPSPSNSSGFDLESSDDEGIGTEAHQEAQQITSTTKYVPPALRRAQQQQEQQAIGGMQSSAEQTAVLRKVRGLINRMTESNLEGIVSDPCTMYKNEGRSYVSTALSGELITSSTEGPRASERFAIVAAACIASLASTSESSEVIATFLSSLGRQLEASLRAHDSLACANLVRLLGCLYLSKAIKPDIMFDVLDTWSDAFTDEHVVSIAGLLTIAGLALRKAEPALMKNFVVEIHEKASSRGNITTRARVMLDLVVDVKNNRMKDKKGTLSISANSSATLANALPPNVAQWFRGCNVDAVAVGGIPWSKIIRNDNKGFWWLQSSADARVATKGRDTNMAVPAADGDPTTAVTDGHLLKLAAKLRMSTDTRRAIFLAIMGSEDAIDAAEKLLRLNLKGSQEREIVRVTVECCMHESAWNPYYGLLLTRLCNLAKGHRVTLNYCLWDFIKESSERLNNGRKIAIFSRLCAHAVVSKALPLASVIKVTDFVASEMDARELLMWKTFFKSVCATPKTNEEVKELFARLTESKEHKELKKRTRLFLKHHVGPWLVQRSEDGVALRCALAENALRV